MWVLLYACFKFSIESTIFQCYTKIGLMCDKVIEIANDIMQLFWKYFSSKIIHLQIKLESPTLSNFGWDRETNWPVLTSIKKPRVPERVKSRTFPTSCSMKNNTQKDNLKSSIIKVETFLKQTFGSWKICKT